MHTVAARMAARQAEEATACAGVWDAVIVGAGVAGLSAANVLARAGKRVLVIEASDRIGGRLRSVVLPVSGHCVELGANWVHGPHPENPVHRLASELRLSGCVDDGDRAELGVVSTLDGQSLDAATAALVDDFDAAHDRMADAARQRGNAGSECSDRSNGGGGGAGGHTPCDDLSVRACLSAAGWSPADDVGRAVEWWCFDFAYAEACETASVRHNVLEEATIDDFGETNWLCTDERGFDCVAREIARQAGLVEGCEDEAARVGEAAAERHRGSCRLLLGATAVRVAVGGGEAGAVAEAACVVRTAAGEAFACRRVIVTASFGVLASGSIDFEPPLTERVRRDVASLGRMGCYVKVFAEWRRAWWRAAEGDAADDGRPSLKRHTLLVGQTRGRWPLVSRVSPSVLCATVVGDEGRRVEAMADEEIAEELHAALAAAFPRVAIPRPDAVRTTRWSADPHFCGSYSFLHVGALPDGWGALQQPVCAGRVWLAGEACHPAYSGFLHGAILSGRETAARVVSSLG